MAPRARARSASAPTTDPASTARPYHHGRLRDALLEAGRSLLREHGAEALTLREISHAAGASHAAAYRHYADKQALLADLAEQGFRELDAAQQQAAASATGDAVDRLAAGGRAYVRFGLAQPQMLQLMFGGAVGDWQVHPGLVDAGRRLAATLAGLIEAGQRSGELREGDPAALALTAWAQVHGLALLVAGRRVPGLDTSDEAACDRAAEASIGLLMRGLRRDRPSTRPRASPARRSPRLSSASRKPTR